MCPLASEFPRALGSLPPQSFAELRGEIGKDTDSHVKGHFCGWETAMASVNWDLAQLLVFLFVDFCQTLLALLMVQSQSLLVLKHLLLGLDFAHHIIECLAHRADVERQQKYHFLWTF